MQSNSRDNRFCVGGQVECRVVIGFDTLYRGIVKYSIRIFLKKTVKISTFFLMSCFRLNNILADFETSF